VPFVYASDLNAMPLESARRNAARFGVADRMSFACAGGLDAVDPSSVSTVVCAGMGGDLIRSIVDAAPWLQDPAYTLILQPQSGMTEFRSWVYAQGFSVLEEHPVLEDGHAYSALKLQWTGESVMPTPGQRFVSPQMLLSRSPDLPEYLDRLILSLKRSVAGMRLSALADEKRALYQSALEEIKSFLSIWTLKEAAAKVLQKPVLSLNSTAFSPDITFTTAIHDENYVVSVVKKTIGPFGGKTVSGCIVLDPVTGETVRYEAEDVPQWIDVVFYGDLICEQYNWHGMYSNGFFNSLFAKKECKQVTTYYASEEELESEDATPVSDYGYISKDGDIWIYTGITSVNGDSSNIGFLLANERTGECRYYNVAGADEKSAMTAAEGEVQEKGYQASFPSLINIEGNPTYIMVLKDSGGLVKLYAAVNVEQYNIVTTAATQSECIEKYKNMLGIETEPEKEETVSVTMTIESIKYVTVEGNTYIYLIDAEENIYKAKAADHEEMLLLSEGDTVALTVAGNTITACERAS